jgi:hypothetical protein
MRTQKVGATISTLYTVPQSLQTISPDSGLAAQPYRPGPVSWQAAVIGIFKRRKQNSHQPTAAKCPLVRYSVLHHPLHAGVRPSVRPTMQITRNTGYGMPNTFRLSGLLRRQSTSALGHQAAGLTNTCGSSAACKSATVRNWSLITNFDGKNVCSQTSTPCLHGIALLQRKL